MVAVRWLLPLVAWAVVGTMAGGGPAASTDVPAAWPGAVGGGWPWPVVGPVLAPFAPPDSPYGPGHRGIDIGTPVGTPVLAPAPGVVRFAGQVGGHLYASVDHGGGLVSTYSWVSSLLVREGEAVATGTPLAMSGAGHPGSPLPHLHFGVKLDGVYVDPLDYLSPGSVVGLVRLAPLDEP